MRASADALPRAGSSTVDMDMAWIARQLGVSNQAVDGFVKYKTRKHRQ